MPLPGDDGWSACLHCEQRKAVEGSRSVHPAAAVFPMLSADDLADLAEDIKANGLLHPIVLDGDGQLIDGRNRLAACNLAGVAPHFETYTGDPLALIVSANISRRHLTKSQQAMALARMQKVTQSVSLRRLGAERTDIGRERVRKAAYLLEHAPDLAEQVEAGASLNDAYAAAVERKKRAEETAADRERRLAHIEQERARILAEIEAGRAAIGAAVQIPPEPDLEIRLSRTEGGTVDVPDPAPVLGAGLEAEHAKNKRMAAIKEQVRALADDPPVMDSWYPEGHVMAIRGWASQIVALVYGMVEAHNAALSDEGQLRRVK